MRVAPAIAAVDFSIRDMSNRNELSCDDGAGGHPSRVLYRRVSMYRIRLSIWGSVSTPS